MEIDTRGKVEHIIPTPQVAHVLRRINVRVEKTLNNPELTPEQRQEVTTLANLSGLALSLGNPLAIGFTKELIELTDPLMSPKENPDS